MTISYATIRVNPADIEAIVESLRAAPKVLRQAYAGAINDTLKGMKTEALASDGPIRKRFPVLRKHVAPYVGIKRATNRELSGSFRFNKSHRLSLRLFEPQQDPGGVTYMIDREKGQQFLPGGFVYPPKARKKIKWVAKRATKKNKPLVFPRALSAWGMFNRAEVWKVVKLAAETRYPKELKQQVAFRLKVLQGHINRRMRNGLIVRHGHEDSE